MKSKQICAVVILYHPDTEVYDNIASYANGVDKVYIVDNSEEVSFDMELLASNVQSSIRLLASGSNLGVATGLDMALHQAESDGYKWLLTMDQDGSFEASEFEKILHCMDDGNNDNILLKASRHNSRNRVKNSKSCHLEKVKITMTSGNLVHVSNAMKIGGYSRKLFIDEVDHEFCLRGQSLGYGVYEFSSIYVNHTLGTLVKVGKRSYRLYPPERVYYMMRNYLYLREKYAKQHRLLFKQRTQFLRSFFLQHLLHSPKRLGCFYMLLRGWYDYKNHTFGVLNEKQ